MSDKITFKELVEKISAQTEQSAQSTNDFIHELAGIIESSLGVGEKISISGFGKFELRWTDERKGRNPQTGEEITIPGQNKVVFKPYKALRERVNRPFENLESHIISDKPTESQAPAKTPVLSFTATSGRSTQTSHSPQEQTEEDLIIERESPVEQNGHITSEKNKSKEPDYKPSAAPSEDEENLAWVFKQKMQHRDKQARDVQSKGGYKWSYTAASMIVLLAIFIFVFVLNNQDESESTESASLPNQSTIAQVDSNPGTGMNDRTNRPGEQSQVSENRSDSGSSTADVSDDDPGVTNATVNHSVAEGESLWTIAQIKYGDPYLWPLIYDANKGALNNPNLLAPDNSLRLPILANPGNLSEAERKMVALGYISVYDWISENQPDDARYYLWAAGSFSQEVLRDASENVNEADLVFATQG